MSSLGELNTVITIGELLKILMNRAELTQKEYAAILGVEREHLNGVMNNRPGFKGSAELIDRALKHARIEWRAVLHPPIDEKTADEIGATMGEIELALMSGGVDREIVLNAVQVLRILRKQKERRTPGKPRIRERSLAVA